MARLTSWQNENQLAMKAAVPAAMIETTIIADVSLCRRLTRRPDRIMTMQTATTSLSSAQDAQAFGRQPPRRPAPADVSHVRGQIDDGALK